MFLSTRCPVCDRPGGVPCAECRELFVAVGPLPPPFGLDALYAAATYDGAARPLITGLKYRNQRAATSWLATAMVAALPAAVAPPVVTWPPTTTARRNERGFDQAELLARAVARRLGSRPRRLLVRRGGRAQTGRVAEERRSDGARFVGARRSMPRAVLLVDDVVTTGSTLSAAATTLRANGAAQVVGLVAAATPPPGGWSR